MTQRYRAWRPDLWPDEPLDFLALHADGDGLRLQLQRVGTKEVYAELLFEHPRAYRSADEGHRLYEQGNLFFPDQPALVYIVDDSDFIAWLRQEALGQLSGFQLVHYLIATINDWIDVISEVAPEVRFTVSANTRVNPTAGAPPSA